MFNMISGGGGDASSAPGWLERALHAGASKTLLKPFKISELCAMAEELLGK